MFAPKPRLRLSHLTLPFRMGLWFLFYRLFGGTFWRAKLLHRLGPSFIKLGQFLATRPDIIGKTRADDLAHLQDALPPFPTKQAVKIIEKDLDAKINELFSEFSRPLAAASIAQVHRAKLKKGKKWVAVKILRPHIAKKLQADMDGFFWIAKWAERFSARARRLRFTETVKTLAQSVALELDLRMEAAAISEMSENIGTDKTFRLPALIWSHSARHVLTTEWIEGFSAKDIPALKKAKLNRKKLAESLLQSFLTHALRDGFFHADMHPGNLFIDKKGGWIGVDLGIMGRLGDKERMFLAEILYGFVTRNYERLAEVHFEAGYVDKAQDKQAFAQALRAIGEPIMGKSADEISMAKLLLQLFEVTEQFDMHTQPQLLLLQKTMVVVEGVARNLDSRVNIWQASEPILKQWIEGKLGAKAQIEKLAEEVKALPKTIARANATARALEQIVTLDGIKLHPESVERLAQADRERTGFYLKTALFLALIAGAIFLLAIAIK